MTDEKTYQDGSYRVRSNNGRVIVESTVVKSKEVIVNPTIEDLTDHMITRLHKSGVAPIRYFKCGHYPVRRAAEYVVQHAIDYAAQVKLDEEQRDKAEFDLAQRAGVVVGVAEITEQYGATLTYARRLTSEEAEQYAPWFRKVGFVGFTAAPSYKVSAQAIREVIGDRKSDGQFSGCSNKVWIITFAEWADIVEIDDRIKIEQQEQKTKMREWEAKNREMKKATGYCFKCQTWCYGDCQLH